LCCWSDDDERQQKLAEDLDHFWRDVLPIMDGAVETSSLHNVARFSCVIDNILKPPADAPAPPEGALETKVWASPVESKAATITVIKKNL